MQPYRGGDRRRPAGVAGRGRPGRTFAVAAAAVLAVWVLFVAAMVRPVGSLPLDAVQLGLQLDVAAAALGVAAALLCVRWWRLAGDAAALLLGAGALLVGALTIGSQALLALLGDLAAGEEALAWLSPASRLAAVGVLWQAARTPPVDARLRLGRTLALALGATAVGVAVLTLAPGLARGLASLGDPLPTVEATAAGSVVLAGCWLLLAAAHGRRGRRRRHTLHSWFALALLALALAELLLLAAATAALPSAGLAPAAAAALRACAMLCALAGAGAALARGFAEQRGRLFEEITSGMTAEARMRAEHLLAQERAHEARNALTAVEGASRTLEVYRERLDPGTQAELSHAIRVEIARLQRLVSPDDAPSEAGEFRVADTLASVVVGARASGTRVDTDVPDDLVASGRPGHTAEVVQNLIENARRYAPHSCVAVGARRHRDGVLVRVEDRGPGVPRSERQAIFARGYRGQHAAATEGTGLGLYICARLMREQGGDLWVDERSGGGASFALWLPGPAPAATGLPREDAPPTSRPTAAGGPVVGVAGDLALDAPRGGAGAAGDQAAADVPGVGATGEPSPADPSAGPDPPRPGPGQRTAAGNVYPLFGALPGARNPDPDPERSLGNDAGR